ncbi:hypothetical protein ACIRTB_11615 [Streptomyces sp. NPDC101158]|uniref:hypothetical protein n=1 Tax=Streptomyces sp. NPDC101158 TaxID=3366117 RepID=UPI0038125F3C
MSTPTPRTEPPITAVIPEYLRAEGCVLTDSLIPLVNRFRARQSDDGTLPAPDRADRALLLRIREEGAAWYRRHALDEQAEALEADLDGWLAAGLDSPPHFGQSRKALPAPAPGETVLLLAADGPGDRAPHQGRRLACLFALYGTSAPGGTSTPAPYGSTGHAPSLVLIAGSEGAHASVAPAAAEGGRA